MDPMLTIDKKYYHTILIILLIAVFSLFALWIRIIPMLDLGSTDILNIVGSDDPLYNLRQIEQVLPHFPGYAWFDAMTYFPNGDFIYWGPLFTYLCAIACMIAGATTRPEIIATSLLVPPILGTLLVPIMYYVGRLCGDWKTGLFASGFTAIVSGQFYYRSFYGYLDHHIAEVFFATIFCLAYIYALQKAKEQKTGFNDLQSLKIPALIAVLAGIAYLLGLFTMPTMILFAMIVAIFTLVQFVIDFYRGDSSEYLVLINTVIFLVSIIGLFLFGIKAPDQDSLAVYSYGHVYAYLALIAGTLLLFGLARALKDKARHLYPVSLAIIGGAASLALFIFVPEIFNLLISSFFAFFGQGAEVLTVEEARGWSVEFAWVTFNYGMILALIGIGVLGYRNIREEHPHQIFALIWSIIVLISTWQHIRYEYYMAINIALLSAVALSFTVDECWPAVIRLMGNTNQKTAAVKEPDSVPPEGKRSKKSKKERLKHGEARSQDGFLTVAIFCIMIMIAALFVFTSFSYSYGNATNHPIRMNQEWRESLEWLSKNTPDTGVDYYAIDTRETFRYPSQAYGVMSWWDYGHMITYIAKRIPNANPFQRGVVGDTGAAAYFVTTSEDTANAIMDQLGTRYIITDIEMDFPTYKFPAMTTWFNSTETYRPYQTVFAIQNPDIPGSYDQVMLNNQSYYLTQVSKLHNFDGSMTEPGQVYYIEYATTTSGGESVPVITNAILLNATEAKAKEEQYNLNAKTGSRAVVMNLNTLINQPVDTVPALRHYRLVHESPSNVFTTKSPDIKFVKIFEYVKGAHIRGEGIIEVPVVTNTNRTFTYRQQSVNGEFIVPYSTSGNPYGVTTTGKYRISGSTKEYDVPEDAVMNGLTVG
jgi:dolichyl-diphosphooligosaccharide--protein glycosyltransferase